MGLPEGTEAVIRIFALAVCAALTGCASLREFNNGAEIAWQVEHVVDVLQTEHGPAMDPCFYEGDTITKNIVGEHPSKLGVAAWGVGFGAFHYGVTAALQHFGWEGAATAWEAATIVDTAVVIGHNYRVGVRVGAPNHDDAACVAYYGKAP